MTEFIVAEVSKNWIEGRGVAGPNEGLVLSEIFEKVIDANRQRGYTLYQFSLTHSFPAAGQLNETIIAVFQKTKRLRCDRCGKEREWEGQVECLELDEDGEHVCGGRFLRVPG